jgi:serine/threonine protein kinase
MPGLEGMTLGRYRLVRRLGKGGMSEVYLSYDRREGRQVAVKVVSGVHAEYLERFRREAEAILNLRHRHILPAYEYGEQEPWYYLAMYYASYGTLSKRLSASAVDRRTGRIGRGNKRQGGPLRLEEAAVLLEQIASALQYAHDSGIIHRDIKPSNILLRNPRYAYLADFGLAKALEGAQGLTQTGSLLGTPEYMAPELSLGPASTSSDIYALGILLYQMVAGRVPFSAETPVATFWKHLRERPMPPSYFNPAIPRSVDLVILHALEKDPRRRFHSPLALAHAYRRALRSSQAARHDTWEAGEAQESSFAFDLPPFAASLPVVDPPPAGAGQPAHQEQQEEILVLPALSALSTDSPGQAEPVQEDYENDTAYPVTTSATIPVEGGVEQRTSLADTPFPASGLASTHTLQPPATRQRSPRTSTMRRRRRKRNPVIVAATVGVGFLLLVALLMSFVYVTGVSRQEAVATATVQAMTTAAAKSARATAEAHAQATATAGVLTNVTGTTPILSDALSGNTAGRWPENDNCQFIDGSYHVLIQQPGFLQTCVSPAAALTFSNGTIQVDVSLLAGDDTGLIFRASGQQFYDFEITGQGAFFLRRHDPGGAGYTYLIQNTSSNAIVSGGPNTLSVIAEGSDFKLYINNTFVGESHDSTYAGGQIGFAAGALASTARAEGSFTNLKIYP